MRDVIFALEGSRRKLEFFLVGGQRGLPARDFFLNPSGFSAGF